MKKTSLLLLCLACLYLYGRSQEKHVKFAIVKTGTKYSAELITLAFSKADMCGNFYEHKSNDILFDDGTIVKLFSIKEQPANEKILPGCARSDNFKFPVTVWSILPSGQMTRGLRASPKSRKRP